jgi:hypothetical protein
MAAYGILRRSAINAPVGTPVSTPVGLWIALALICYALSLGPILHVHAIPQTSSIMPYAWLEALLPPLKLSGCPSRITVMFALSVSILASVGIGAIWSRRRWTSAAMIAAFAMAMAIDLWPIPFASTPVLYPNWTTALRQLPLKGAVISRAYDNPGAELYCQTLYDRPMAFGYISRVPASVNENDAIILACAENGSFAALRDKMGFVYLILGRNARLPNLPIVYSDDTVVIQELPDGTK